MENSFRYFSNTACKYYPCHEGMEGKPFNCLFCYCPLNFLEKCPGKPKFIKGKDGKRTKDCMSCTFPHIPENYDIIIEILKKNKMRF